MKEKRDTTQIQQKGRKEGRKRGEDSTQYMRELGSEGAATPLIAHLPPPPYTQPLHLIVLPLVSPICCLPVIVVCDCLLAPLFTLAIRSCSALSSVILSYSPLYLTRPRVFQTLLDSLCRRGPTPVWNTMKTPF